MSKLYEEVNPFQYTGKGKMDVRDAAVRDNINTLLTGALMACTLTPYIALEKVRKVLAYFHISIPGTSFMEGDRGIKTFEVEQFGLKFGIKNDGQIVNFNSVDKDMTHGAHIDGENFNYFTAPGTENTDEKFHIYFEYKMNDKGLFDVFSEIVTDDELEDLLDDAEEDINADKSEDDRDERLNEAKSPEALDRKAARQAVIGKVLSAIGAKRTGNRMMMRAHLTSKKADMADDEREEKLYPTPSDKKKIDEAKNVATKVLNELKLYNPNGSSSINLPGPLQPGTDPKSYESRERSRPLSPGTNPRDYIRNLPDIINRPADTKPGGDGPPTGTDLFKGIEPRKPGTPSPALKPGETSIHGNTNEPYTGPKTNFSGPDAKPMTSAEMQTGGYSQKIQETSHETVNHVRRLAMKNKRNDR